MGRGKRLLILAGATATGKSSIATRFSQLCPIEIVVADSVQIRKNVELGATKPTTEEMKSIPHHLVNLVDTTSFFSAGDYIDAIKPVLCDIFRRNEKLVPTVVGGNTMWLDWLINGVPDAPGGTKIGKQEARDILKYHSEHGKWDEAVSLISDLFLPEVFHPPSRNDWHRLHRFLEVYLAKKEMKQEKITSDPQTKRMPSILNMEPLNNCDVRCFFLSDDRLRLYRNIDRRCESMVQMGLIEEVCKLLLDGFLFALPENTSGFTSVSPVCSAAIGYRQTVNYLLQDNYQFENIEQFVAYLKSFTTATRNYAKHQLHWYRNQNSFLWLHPRGKSNDYADGVTKELDHWMRVPREEYEDMLSQQIKGMKHYEEQIKLMDKKATRNYHNPKTQWSAEEPMLRACEGNTNPEVLRRYSERFYVMQDQEKLRALIRRIDRCRLKLEREVGKAEGLKNSFMLIDHEGELSTLAS